MTRRQFWHIALSLAATLLVLFATFCLSGSSLIIPLMFHPPTSRPCEGLQSIGTSNDISVLFMPSKSGEYAILYSHGNAEDLTDCRPLLSFYNSFGYSVLGYDYPGYGRSRGKPSEHGVYKNAESAYRYLVETLGFSSTNIIIAGYSIGGGPACYLAEKYQVKALVLLSTFTSAVRAVTRAKVIPYDPFPNIERIRNVKCPILILHGTRDAIVPYSCGKKLAAAGGKSQFVTVKGAGHDNLISVMGEEEFKRVVTDFVKSCP